MTEEIIRQFSIAARYGKQEEGGHLPRVRAAKAARACVVFDRLGPFGFVLYFLIIVSAIVALVHVTSRVADYAIASRAREASAATRTSRVAVGLEAQQRAAGWQPSGSVPEKDRQSPMFRLRSWPRASTMPKIILCPRTPGQLMTRS
jgi:hypothetical protein